MGLRSGEYFGRNTRRAATSRIALRTSFPFWDPRLSRMTTSPGLSVGTSHRGIGFDPRSAERRPHSAWGRDVRFRRPRSLQELPIWHELSGAMAAMSGRLSGPWRSTRPSFDGHRFDRPPPGGSACPSSPRRSPGHAGVASTVLPSPPGLRPASRLNQNLADSGIWRVM
jgi:hypothetical protein